MLFSFYVSLPFSLYVSVDNLASSPVVIVLNTGVFIFDQRRTCTYECKKCLHNKISIDLIPDLY